jgi:hypothetical protein
LLHPTVTVCCRRIIGCLKVSFAARGHGGEEERRSKQQSLHGLRKLALAVDRDVPDSVGG